MYLIDKNFDKIEFEKDLFVDFWNFDFSQEAFMLEKSVSHWEMDTDTCDIQVGNHIVTLPVNFFIVIGDYETGLDCIKPEEIVGREFDVLTIGSKMERESWELEPMKVVGFTHQDKVLIPHHKKKCMYPVYLSDKKFILVAVKDIFHSIKTYGFNDII